jgi:3-hydroxybutyryl-CoA dehydratase
MNQFRLSDLHIGFQQEFDATLTTEDAEDFARLSGDVNPLHVDHEYAVTAGLPSTVLFGMLTSALYSRLVGVYLPGKFALFQGIDMDFSTLCHAGEQLHVEGEIVHMTEACHRFEIRATIPKADRKLGSKANIRVGFHGD